MNSEVEFQSLLCILIFWSVEANDALQNLLTLCEAQNPEGNEYDVSSCFLPQDNHEEDYFLYVAYSDESVYGK